MSTLSRIPASRIADAVCALYRDISLHLREDVAAAIRRAEAEETSTVARDILRQLIENAEVSRREGLPLCQDTGLAVVCVEMGNAVVVEDSTLADAIAEGVRRAQRTVPLRASVAGDPLERRNTGDNTPPIVYIEHVQGRELTIRLLAKGGGAENTSRIFMLSPADGREGIIAAVVDTVREAGAKACPPVIVGVGMGGDFALAPLLAKKALLRDVGSVNDSPDLAALEAEILTAVNALGIGPQGLGGRTTALGVMIERHPCHIASLPLAVNIECHSHRHGTVVLTAR